jgi:hypothetical protein
MTQSLRHALDSLKVARVLIRERQTNSWHYLIRPEEPFEIVFNGFSNLTDYELYLEGLFQPCEERINDAIKTVTHDNLEQLKRALDMLYFEVTNFRRRFFSSSQSLTPLNRIELRNELPEQTADPEIVKILIMRFFSAELLLLKRLEMLYLHRLEHLKNYYNLPPEMPGASDQSMIARTIASNLKGQQSLFPFPSQDVTLQWTAEKVDFVEIFSALFDIGAVQSTTGKMINRKAFISTMMLVFNINIKNIDGTLATARRRKKNTAPFLYNLYRIFISNINS